MLGLLTPYHKGSSNYWEDWLPFPSGRFVVSDPTTPTGARVFFPPDNNDQLYNNIAGVAVAMIGVVLYSHLKYAAGQNTPDCMDTCCPTCIIRVIEPQYTSVELEAIEEKKTCIEK